MELSEIYQQIDQRLDGIDFSSLYHGFYRLKFALYNETECYFNGKYISKSDSFLANTAIEYEGEYIAIWMITEDISDFDSLTASIVHEMFHGYQNIMHESRWSDEMKALLNYQYSIDNLSKKYREAQLLKQCIEGNHKEAFNELCQIRKERLISHSYEYDYEARVEQIEGSAKYVEWQALQKLNPQKGHIMHEKMIKEIVDPKQYFPIRIISYSIGALLLEAIRKYTAFDFESFTDIPFSIAVLKDTFESTNRYYQNEEMSQCLLYYQQQTKDIIQKSLTKNECIVDGKYHLLEVNIYDARYFNHYVISNYFVSYQNDETEKILNGDFLILLDDDGNLVKIYRQ
ncbi:MAG: hypothetical protein WC201_02780 [Bacilli bacterium]